MLLGESDGPAFFLSAAPDAPAVGFGSRDAKLILTGPAEHGRVPVRAHGRLTLEAYVPERLLELRAQRVERLAGTPVTVGPNDRVRVLGPAREPGLLEVEAMPRWGSQLLGPFTGTLPVAALAANEATGEPGPDAAGGLPYRLPARSALPVYDAPQGELLALIAPDYEDRLVQVVSLDKDWYRVRVGDGPYLIGYTNAPLTLATRARPTDDGQRARETGPMPQRIEESAGALRRIAKGTRVRFGQRSIATFRSDGWARVLLEQPDGDVEVLAAADDQVTVRGLVRASELLAVEPADTRAADTPRLARERVPAP
jgi:hypothetical protein